LVCLSLGVLLGSSAASAQQPPPRTAASPAQQSSGTITGTIVDPRGTGVGGARVRLAHKGQSAANQEVLSADDGRFSFANIAPGPFQLIFTVEGLTTQVFNGILHPGESYIAPQIRLALPTQSSEVRVTVPTAEVAEEEIKEQEKQRVLGVVPNFYVTYLTDPAPLTSKQKFKLAWKTTVDPVTFGLIGAVAGIQEADGDFSGYGPGAEGYAKRYGAAYADLVAGTFIGSAILPSLLKQDPRYFYKGTGSTRSRFLYAIANSVICKGDNKRWQANYSNILGNLAAGGISNLYYPASNRNGAALTFENAAVGIAAAAGANVLEEFVIRKLTPNIPTHANP